MGTDDYCMSIDVQNPGAIQNAMVFEYCEEQYALLKKQDGAYYATNHDRIVFEKASQTFHISEDEAVAIFYAFTKPAANIEITRMRKMSPKKRKKAYEQRAHDLLCENHDNPFYKVYGEPSSQLSDPLDVLYDEYQQMVVNIAAAGWTIPLDIDIRHFEQLKKIAKDASALDSYMLEYYSGKERKLICRKIERILTSSTKKKTFNECVKAYDDAMYSACLVTLLSLLDGFVSEFGDDPADVRVMRVCNFHAQEEKDKRHHIKSLCWLSMYQFTQMVFQKSDFNQVEPDEINRHWIQHGRSDRTPSELDCLKVLNAISTLTIIKQAEDALMVEPE